MQSQTHSLVWPGVEYRYENLRYCSIRVVLFAHRSRRMHADMAPITVPVGLAPGSLYYLAFETQGTITATSGNINTYNNFVNAQARLAGLGFFTWYAIVSTANTSAIQNVSPALTKDKPVYLLDGTTMVTDSVDDMFTGRELKTRSTKTSSARLIRP